ncbi:MAG TPA: non-ribosomal peptide synthetase [Stellaceae bacterium]|jgi:amino acid adenylation domain-containing protein|nr:non-ribosomal peptide synthetase [Stellaceae bacterium]
MRIDNDNQCSDDVSIRAGALRSTNSVLDLIDHVARAWPNAIALTAGGSERITYHALMTATDALAAELVERGAGTDIPIGICIDRSIDHVIAMLGILRAGSCFLPLDPEWPASRLCHVLDDSGAPIVIAAARFAERLSAPGRIILNAAPEARRNVARRDMAMPTGETLAYIIYTSGSTGEPKGVEVTHRNLLHLVAWHRDAFGVSPQDKASWIAGLGFDASIWELFPNLAAGASIHLPDDRIRGSADALRTWLVEQSVSVAFAPTPLAEALIGATWPAQTALRILLAGGDTLHVRPKPGLPFRVVNNYGPTECTVVATSGDVAPASISATLPTIGKPIADAEIVILDGHGNPVPAGEIGEIYVGGAGVARGYRHRPRQTEERFVTLTPSGVAKRYYRTGDLGCVAGDGEIVFHGRCDDQIKVRGHRVEPDEISAALSHHPGVAQSAVIAEGEGIDKQLIAYIVAKGEESPRAAELRDFLAARLPNYMLPATYVQIEALPLTANGKLDKSALPAPSAANTLATTRYRAPSTVVESRVASIVETLLGVQGVGVDDNFFLLGGHSLLGTQLVLRLRDAFGAELTLRDLFEAQTIQNLAERVEELVTKMVAGMSDAELEETLAH